MERNKFIIPLNGLTAGESTFLFRADKEFFAKFENYEVLDADLRVSIVADKKSDFVDFDLGIEGTVTVPCDRCFAPVAMHVSSDGSFRCRRGDSVIIEDDQEEVFPVEGTDELDFSQEVYDYALLALPLQKFHKEGECDAVALGYLSKGSPDTKPEQMDSPFSALADLLKKK